MDRSNSHGFKRTRPLAWASKLLLEITQKKQHGLEPSKVSTHRKDCKR